MLNSSCDKKKARTEVERGEQRLLSDPGSELHLGRDKEKRKHATKIDGMSKKHTTHMIRRNSPVCKPSVLAKTSVRTYIRRNVPSANAVRQHDGKHVIETTNLHVRGVSWCYSR